MSASQNCAIAPAHSEKIGCTSTCSKGCLSKRTCIPQAMCILMIEPVIEIHHISLPQGQLQHQSAISGSAMCLGRSPAGADRYKWLWAV